LTGLVLLAGCNTVVTVECIIDQYVTADLNGRCDADGGPACVDCSPQGSDAASGMAAQKCALDAIANLQAFRLLPPTHDVPGLGYSGFPSMGRMVVREYAYAVSTANGQLVNPTVSMRLCNLDPPLSTNDSCTLGPGGACLLCHGNQAGSILCAP
jgi:hypothetical protein